MLQRFEINSRVLTSERGRHFVHNLDCRVALNPAECPQHCSCQPARGLGMVLKPHAGAVKNSRGIRRGSIDPLHAFTGSSICQDPGGWVSAQHLRDTGFEQDTGVNFTPLYRKDAACASACCYDRNIVGRDTVLNKKKV